MGFSSFSGTAIHYQLKTKQEVQKSRKKLPFICIYIFIFLYLQLEKLVITMKNIKKNDFKFKLHVRIITL